MVHLLPDTPLSPAANRSRPHDLAGAGRNAVAGVRGLIFSAFLQIVLVGSPSPSASTTVTLSCSQTNASLPSSINSSGCRQGAWRGSCDACHYAEPRKISPRTPGNGVAACACEVMRPPNDLPPANSGVSGSRWTICATAARTLRGDGG